MLQYFLPVLAYFIGSIPFALVIGKIGYGVDIREHGSGNLGGTNTFRVLGKKAGLMVTIADILKGTIATALPVIFVTDIHPLIVGLFAVIGHMYPVFAGFRGGKAVATSGGLLLFYSPVLFISLFVAFFIFLFLTKYVSLASILTSVYGVIHSLFTQDLALILIISLLASFVIYRHRVNIKRIIDKTEPKISWL